MREQRAKKRFKLRIFGALPLLLASPAFAQSPHFVGQPVAKFAAGYGVAVGFYEAGVGNDAAVDYNVVANASGACACMTYDGRCASGHRQLLGFTARSGSSALGNRRATRQPRSSLQPELFRGAGATAMNQASRQAQR
jgi:hypothetical protein